MTITLSLILVAILITVIAVIKKRLIFELQSAGLLLFHNAKVGVYLYSIVFLPGTILHELSHWLIAEILQVPTGELQVLPSLSETIKSEERLGFVMTGRTDPIRSFLIGFAPFITGTITLVILGSLLDSFWGIAPWWQLVLLFYGLIVVGQSMIISRADSRNWPIISVLILAFYILFSRLGIVFTPVAQANIASILMRINQALGLTILLNLVMIGGCYMVRRLLEKLTKQKIVRGRKNL